MTQRTRNPAMLDVAAIVAILVATYVLCLAGTALTAALTPQPPAPRYCFRADPPPCAPSVEARP